ncbi:MAG: IclR family transcriptional regulator [Nocardioidaceae bacterium]
MNTHGNTPVDLVGRTGVVLRAISAHEPRGLTTTGVATATGLARPTAHRLLVALTREGLVERDLRTHRWLLGPELFFLGRSASPRYDVTALAEPFVQRLARVTGESAFFSVRRGDQTICLLREDGSFPIRSHVLYEGIRFPLGVASAGLAILAYLPDVEADAFLARTDLEPDFGPAHAPAAVRARIAETRTRGWALNPGLIVEGSWGIGAAVFDSQDRPRWALSLTGVEQRFGGERSAEYGRVLLDSAHELSRVLVQRGE